MSNQRILRPFSVVFLLSLFLAQGALWSSHASAQSLKNIDAAISPFGQVTSTSSGNGITDKPSRSMGGLATFRQSYKPWLGYEVNYSYTRFSEAYSGQPFSVQDNVHEATGAYLVQTPKLLVFQPFAAVGTGYLLFLPTEVGGQHNHQQGRMPLLFEAGVNYPILTSHVGARIEYRGLEYKTPNFNEPYQTTGSSRITSEIALGLYLHF
jgi:opacity protein-like surface antigen